MTPQRGAVGWRGLGVSVRGAQHIKHDKPCQDALAWSPQDRQGPLLVLAVADGHGGDRYVRSDVGARLAVDTAAPLVEAFLRERMDVTDPEEMEFDAAPLPSMIEDAWKQAIEAHRATLDSATLGSLGAPDGGWGGEAAAYIPYGTTLMVIGVTPLVLLAMQLGDGDIIAIGADGAAWRPLPEDPLLDGNATTSLCLPDAARFMRVACVGLTPGSPTLVMAATDGYGNSFAADAGLLQAALEYSDMISSHGHDWVAAHLEPWLQETSTLGSGDDITLGLLFEDHPRAAAGPGRDDAAGESGD